jgi:hypothetical protein
VGNKIVLVIGMLCLGLVGCSKMSKVKQAIVKDVPIEERNRLLEKYTGRIAWTRAVLEDLTKRDVVPGETRKGIIARDTKIEIVDINFAFKGAVTVQTMKKKRIVHGLEIERPLSVVKIEDKMDEIFWFKSPMLRHVDYIRKWGKKTARSVRNHEVFIGMPKEAALESWGIPTDVRINEIGGNKEEQWVYKDGKKSRYIYISDGKITKWEE